MANNERAEQIKPFFCFGASRDQDPIPVGGEPVTIEVSTIGTVVGCRQALKNPFSRDYPVICFMHFYMWRHLPEQEALSKLPPCIRGRYSKLTYIPKNEDQKKP